jgi:chemotaxis protein CheX
MQIQADFFQPFVDGTLHTLKVQCLLEASPGTPFIKSEVLERKEFAIAGVVGITSPQLSGSISIFFSKLLFLKIIENMLNEKHSEITGELCDAAGELLNIIFGQAKHVLNQKGFDFQMANPSVVYGQSLLSHLPKDKPVLVLPFRIGHENLHVEIAVAPVRK